MMSALIALALLCLIAAPVEMRNVEGPDEICLTECKDLPMDISFVVDASSSIYGANFTMGLWFMTKFVKKFDVGPNNVRFSMVTYGDRVYQEDSFGFSDYSNKEQLANAIDAVPYRAGSATETGDGITYMLDHQMSEARTEARKVVIVLTDGNSQNARKTENAAKRARESGLEVFAIGVGINVTKDELHRIAGDWRHVFIVGTYEMLKHISGRLIFETCEKDPEPPCRFDPVDLTFVIDSSVSIGREDFTVGLEFINEFLDVFEINPSAVRVSAVMYGFTVYSQSAIPFDRYNNKEETIDAIMSLEWMHGNRTETGMGIKYMVDHFKPHMRPHAAHIGIVITDGKSQEPRKTARAAEEARSQRITMLAVGVGKIGKKGNLDMKELISISGDKSRVLIAEDYARLNTVREALTRLTCQGIALNFN